DLSANEFCPFTGTLFLDQTDIQHFNDTTKTPVFVYDPNRKQMCEGFSINTYEKSGTQKTKWEINRIGRGAAIADLQSEMDELIEEHEENDCYTCKSGRIGGRIWTRTTSQRFVASRVSEESKSAEDQTNDARIEIRFQDDSTYLLIIKATSVFEKNTDVSIQETATGTCDGINTRQTFQTANTIFLNATLGPFKGTSSDTQLSGSGTVELPSNQDGGESELVYRFSFRR
ncbi:MAG TPA: hypothetical protein P5338_09890, partial [Bacteroidales bacterium]|nr:hypothetical protein [Bacteroidales bacterium]